MNIDWQVKISENPGFVGINVFIFRNRFDNKVDVIQGDVINTVSEGEGIKPTLILNHSQLQAFAEALNKIGINPTREYTEGKLEATQNHLADLRTMLKLK